MQCPFYKGMYDRALSAGRTAQLLLYDFCTICQEPANMHEGRRHIVRKVGSYHWNNLSVVETGEIFKRYASSIQVIHIDTFLRSNFGCGDTHNKGAYTLIVSK